MAVNDNNNHAIENTWESRFDQLISKLNDIERQLSDKADEVVTIQVLQHRNELEELETKLEYIEARMNILSQIDEEKLEVIESPKLQQKKPFMRRIASIFTL